MFIATGISAHGTGSTRYVSRVPRSIAKLSRLVSPVRASCRPAMTAVPISIVMKRSSLIARNVLWK
jgi:hypothetical protein